MNKKAIIFDFDGVILDSEKYHFLSWKETLNSLSIDFTFEEYEPLKSRGKAAIIDHLIKFDKISTPGESCRTAIYEQKDQLYKNFSANYNSSNLINGVVNFIEYTKTKGYFVCIASSSSNASYVVKKLGLAQYFDIIIDGKTSLKKKPEPDVFNYCVDNLHINNKDALVFEDSIVGLEAAHNAGIDSIYLGNMSTQYALFNIIDFTDERLKELL